MAVTLNWKGFLKNSPWLLYLKFIALEHETKNIPIGLAKLWNTWLFDHEEDVFVLAYFI